MTLSGSALYILPLTCYGSVCIERDGWLTCNFMSFSIVFQSYQDDGQVIMRGSVQWNLTVDKTLPREGSNSGPLYQ